MSGWQVGDLALCIKIGTWRTVTSMKEIRNGPRPGSIHQVSAVAFPDDIGGSAALYFDEFMPGRFNGRRFRKVTPPKADEFDREVIEHLTGAPVKEKA